MVLKKPNYIDRPRISVSIQHCYKSKATHYFPKLEKRIKLTLILQYIQINKLHKISRNRMTQKYKRLTITLQLLKMSRVK